MRNFRRAPCPRASRRATLRRSPEHIPAASSPPSSSGKRRCDLIEHPRLHIALLAQSREPAERIYPGESPSSTLNATVLMRFLPLLDTASTYSPCPRPWRSWSCIGVGVHVSMCYLLPRMPESRRDRRDAEALFDEYRSMAVPQVVDADSLKARIPRSARQGLSQSARGHLRQTLSVGLDPLFHER